MKYKFRVWDKENKKFVKEDLYVNQDGEIWRGGVNWTDRYDLMMYTGLHDKNGKPIYENDLVEVGGIVGTVTYDTDYAGFFATFIDGDNIISAKLNNPNIEIVGNIYQNSNLVK